MYTRFQKRKPTPVSTLPLEQSVDQTYASLQSQMEMLDKMTRIFGNSQDPIIKFQINQLRNQLADDIKRLAFTGTDLHHIQEVVGADIVKAHILNARKSIDEDKNGKQPVFDMINDQQFAESEERLRYQQLLNNPLIKQAVDEYIQAEKFQDPRRVELQKMYMARGMPYQQAYNRSAQNIKIDREQVIEDQLASLLARLPKHMAKPILEEYGLPGSEVASSEYASSRRSSIIPEDIFNIGEIKGEPAPIEPIEIPKNEVAKQQKADMARAVSESMLEQRIRELISESIQEAQKKPVEEEKKGEETHEQVAKQVVEENVQKIESEMGPVSKKEGEKEEGAAPKKSKTVVSQINKKLSFPQKKQGAPVKSKGGIPGEIEQTENINASVIESKLKEIYDENQGDDAKTMSQFVQYLELIQAQPLGKTTKTLNAAAKSILETYKGQLPAQKVSSKK